MIGTLLHQDPALFSEGVGRGRLIHRKAFASFLPPTLQDNPTKYRKPEGGLEQWRAKILDQQMHAIERCLPNMRNLHSAIFTYWNVEEIHQEIENVMVSSKPTIKATSGISQAIAAISALSSWWHSLDN